MNEPWMQSKQDHIIITINHVILQLKQQSILKKR